MNPADSAIEHLEKARDMMKSERAQTSIVGRALTEEELARLEVLAAAVSHVDSAISVLKGG